MNRVSWENNGEAEAKKVRAVLHCIDFDDVSINTTTGILQISLNKEVIKSLEIKDIANVNIST